MTLGGRVGGDEPLKKHRKFRYAGGDPEEISTFDRENHHQTNGPGWRRRSFGDRLGPIRRYLESQVGRPWDNVYAELRASYSMDNLAGRHLLEHVEFMVIRNAEWVDGQVKVVFRHSYPLVYHDPTVNDLYVHPKNRLLCKGKRPRNYWLTERPSVRDAAAMTIDHELLTEQQFAWFKYNRFTKPSFWYEKRGGMWFRIRVTRRFIQPHPEWPSWRTPDEHVTTKAQQLGRKELRNLGLKNDNQ